MLSQETTPRNISGGASLGPLLHWMRMEKHLKKIIGFLSFALVFVAFVKSDYFLYPHAFPKTILFYAIIEVIVALFLLLMLLNRNYWPRLRRTDVKGKMKFDWILILASAYLGTQILSTIFSANPYNSFFGTISRSNGLLTLLHFWALFIVLVCTFREKKFWLWFLRLNVGAGLVMACLAIYQLLQQIDTSGTLGNQAYLSGYLLITIFLSGTLFFWSRTREEKLFLIISAIVEIFVLFFITDIRGSRLGFVVGVLSALALYSIAHNKKRVRKFAYGAISLVFALSVLYSSCLLSSGKIYTFFERSSTVATRLTSWKIGLQGLSDKPLLGYGLENYHIVFEKYLDPVYFQQQSTETGFDLPHNKIIEVAVSSGIVGVSTYVLLFLGIFWLLSKKFLSTRNPLLLPLFGMWTAYQVHLFFLFDNVVSFFMFFSLLAFTSFVLREPAEEKESKAVLMRPVLAGILSLAVLIAAASSLYFFSYRPGRVDFYADQTVDALLRKDYTASLETLEKMERMETFYVSQQALFELNEKIIITFMMTNQFNDIQKDYLEKIITTNEAHLAIDSSHTYYLIPLSRLLFIAGKFDASNYAKGELLLQRLVDSGSRRMQVYAYLAEFYQVTNQNEKAIEFGKKALAVDPTYGYANYALAYIYHHAKMDNQAAYYSEQAIKYSFSSPSLYRLYADATMAKGDYARSIIAFSELTRLEPNNPQNYADLARIYLAQKNYAEAREISQQLIEKFPQLRAQMQAFINTIPN